MRKLLISMAAVLAMLTACDSLEDTYKDFAGDGPIRYPGKCKNVTVAPGWECLRVSWNLSNDPAIKNIIVKCVSEEDSVVKVLVSTATECTIENLSNNNYTVSVQSEATDGELSLAETFTERPYTYEHEAVRAFTRGFSKAYMPANHLLLIMSGWDEGIDRFWVSYTNTDGTKMEKDLDQEAFDGKYVDVTNVDTSKPVVLNRRASIQGCEDIIDFQPIEIQSNVIFNSDFQRNVNARYGINNDGQGDFAATCERLELDYDLLSLDDLFYFTKLKTVVLGKNHYYDDKNIVLPTVDDAETSLWVMEKMNEIYGTTVEQYGKSFFNKELSYDFVSNMDYSKLPELQYLDTKDWTIDNDIVDNSNDALVYLLDNDPTTTWSSWPSIEGIRTMKLTIDMKKEQDVNGVKIVQTATTESANYQPSNIAVEYSLDNKTWENFTYSEINTIGKAQGEASLLNATSTVKARYLRFTVSELSYKGQVKVALADIAVY